MADTSYQYSISADFPNQRVDAGALGKEVEDSSIASAGFLYVNTDGDDCDVWFDDPLSGADQTTLDGLVAVHQGNPLYAGEGTDPVSADPSTDVLEEGDYWYNSTDKLQKYYDGAAVVAVQRLYFGKSGGAVYLDTATDDFYIGGSAPNGVWFDDGDLVLGGSAMTGTERLKVVGGQLIDQDANAVSLDIDSEATGSPLINLQPINGNSRGDIAFGVTRTADPTSPSEADFWYNATDEELKFRKSTSSVFVRDAIKLQTYNIDTTAPTDEYVLAWNNGASQWEPTDLNSLPGSYGEEATSTTTTTTTSTTDVLMAGMTITPPAGTYWVIASSDLMHSNNGRSIWISIYVNGVQIIHSERMIRSPRWNNASWEGFTQAIVTVNGSQAIELRWRTNNNTATAGNRAVGVMRIS